MPKRNSLPASAVLLAVTVLFLMPPGKGKPVSTIPHMIRDRYLAAVDTPRANPDSTMTVTDTPLVRVPDTLIKITVPENWSPVWSMPVTSNYIPQKFYFTFPKITIDGLGAAVVLELCAIEGTQQMVDQKV